MSEPFLHRNVLLDRDVEARDQPGNVARVIDVAYCDRERTWQLLVVVLAFGHIEVWAAPTAKLLPRDSERPPRPL